MKNSFFEQIKSSVIEREVEDVYNKGISLYFPDTDITHPFACDGLINTKTENGKLLKLIIEYKLDEVLTSRVARAKVIIQVLYYLKRFENEGMILPNVCLIGDKNECFVFHCNDIIKFLDKDTDWSYAPSAAHIKNPEFVMEIASDENFNPFIFTINEDFSFKAVADKIKDLADNVQRYVHITEHNIVTIYETFMDRVIKVKKMSSKELVSVFLGIITNPDEYYKHPTKKNTLVTPKGNVDIDGGKFDAFFSYFQKSYTPQEITKFTEIADRLIEDTERRNSGDFWTPTLFCDYAHKMIGEELGEDWKENYVVWDCACGTKNLTRDYRFKEIYCSTLFDSELQMSKNYNTEGTSFQFDFLNDYIPTPDALIQESKLPDGLVNALKENKPIVFFINPPYGTACNGGTDGTKKSGINDTVVRKEMRNDNQGAGAENLQHQFLYRICKIIDNYHLTNARIALFSNPIYLSGGKQKDFLKFFCNHFEFKKGSMFCASEFADCSDRWGITFNIWKQGKTEDIHNFVHTLIKKNEDNEIVEFGEKNIYNVWDKTLLSDWVKEPIKGLKTFDAPQLSSALVCKEKGLGKIANGALGYYASFGNGVYKNQTDVYIVNSAGSAAHGYSIMKDNFIRTTVAFTARRLIENTWHNHFDEYFAPDETNADYHKFELDSVIYSLFDSKSNQSSLRNVEYKGKTWNIKNEFFFLSKDKMMKLANENKNTECYNDARTSNERYVYEFIAEHWEEFSDDAKAVYNKAKELVEKSFKYRELFNDEEPKYQINNFDAGWYQIKGLLKAYMPNELKEFNELYKKFSNRLRPMVYELGFLKK